MFDFVRKPQIWRAMDAGYQNEIRGKIGFQLKTMQDLAIYAHLRGLSGLDIAEIGGGDSRILPRLATTNRCHNIEPFEGADNGPKSEVRIDGVQNIRTTVGKFDPALADNQFDVLFSVSVVEHIPHPDFDAFLADCVRILKPGGRMYHAIDMYIAKAPTDFWLNRFSMYRRALTDRADLEPIGEIVTDAYQFETDMASNPDSVMYDWKALSPSLDALRQVAQSVSLQWGARKRDPAGGVMMATGAANLAQ